MFLVNRRDMMAIKSPLEQVDELINYTAQEEENWMSVRDGCKKNSDDWIHDNKMFCMYFRIRIILTRHKEALPKSQAIGDKD
jgi:hypothetical protein